MLQLALPFSANKMPKRATSCLSWLLALSKEAGHVREVKSESQTSLMGDFTLDDLVCWPNRAD